MDQEKRYMLVCNAKTYSDIKSTYNFNHILWDYIFLIELRKSLRICITIVMYYTLLHFKFWCIDSLKMAEFCWNTQNAQEIVLFMYIRCAYIGCINEKFSDKHEMNNIKKVTLSYISILCDSYCIIISCTWCSMILVTETTSKTAANKFPF